jgi:protein-tyrosine-phosphatase
MSEGDKPPLTAVLFICSLNAVRSPMAEALARRRYGKKLYIDSAGILKFERDPFALAALKEVGIDFDGDQPKNLDEVEYGSFDLVIALSREAYGEAKELLRTTSVELIHWPIEDATQVTGTREQRMGAYRQVRDTLDKLIRDEIAPRLPT